MVFHGFIDILYHTILLILLFCTLMQESRSSLIQQLCCSCLKALTAILKDNQQSKDIFSSVIGYTQLLGAIEKLCPLNQAILEAVKEMVRGPVFLCSSCLIHFLFSCLLLVQKLISSNELSNYCYTLGN